MPLNIITSLLILVTSAFIFGTIFKYLKQPPVIGYLIAGLILGLTVGDRIKPETISFLSDLGVILLLFTLGLEFPLGKIKKIAQGTFSAAFIQITGTTLILTAFGCFIGMNFFQAFFVATAFSLSSTAIIIKILSDKGELETLPGEILITWSVIQDLSVLPMIILLPAIGKELLKSSFYFSSFLILLKELILSIVLLGLVLLLGKKWLPRIMAQVAALNNRELLLVAVFIISLTAAIFTQMLGLSAAIGAFLVGILIARTSMNHAIFSEIRPLRDLFALIFFVTLGLMVPQGFIFSHFGEIMFFTFVVIFVKFIIVLVLTLYLGWHARISFIVSLGLINVGEFAFVLAQTGLREQVLPIDTYALIISVALLSIVISPPLFLGAPFFYGRFKNFFKKYLPPVYTLVFSGIEHKDTLEELPFSNHVVLCGYGRVGKYIGRALEMSDIPCIVIEYNYLKRNELKNRGVEVVYGDPSDIDILDYAQVDHAKAVVIAIPDLQTQSMIITNSLSLNKNIKVFCRTHSEDNQAILKAYGATSVIQPEFEASISIADKILKIYGESQDIILGKISRLKIEHGLG